MEDKSDKIEIKFETDKENNNTKAFEARLWVILFTFVNGVSVLKQLF